MRARAGMIALFPTVTTLEPAGPSWPTVGLLVALPDHYPNNFDTLGHLGLIYLATAIFAVGALWALRGVLSARSG